MKPKKMGLTFWQKLVKGNWFSPRRSSEANLVKIGHMGMHLKVVIRGRAADNLILLCVVSAFSTDKKL